MRICGYALLIASFWLLACDADEPCDKGEKHEQGACTPDDGESGSSAGGKSGSSSPSGGKGGAKDAGGNPTADAGPAIEDAGARDSGAPQTECNANGGAALGEDCMTDTDCSCDAPYCAKMPGAAMGFCSVFCDPDPDDCPDGYMCFDLSKLGVEGYEPFCIPKS